MAAGAFVQNNFTGGEWSKFAQGQTSDPRYKTALNVCLNAYPTEEKTWIRRPGTRHTARSRGGNPARLISLNFTDAAPYNMEFTDGHIRMISNETLVKEADAFIVTSISTDTPAVITVSSAPEWEEGEVEFNLADIKATPALAVLAYRQFTITVLTPTTFSVHDSVTGAPLNGNDVGWTPGMSLRVARIVDYDTPYTNGEWRTIKAVQSDKKTLLLQSTKVPQVFEVVTLPSENAPASFVLNEAVFKDGPYLDPVVGSIITPDATIGVVNMRLSFASWSSTRAYRTGDYVTSSGVGYRSLTEVNLNNTPASTVGVHWEVVNEGQPVGPDGFTTRDIGRVLRFKDSASNWSWGRIVAMSDVGAIPGTISGSVSISPGGYYNDTQLTTIFDDVASKPGAASVITNFGSGVSPVYRTAGKDYSSKMNT